MNLVWLDTETTGLDPNVDSVLEIAIVVTTPDLAVLAEDSFVIDWGDQTDEVLAQCDDYVLSMHEKNGLLAECIAPSVRPFAKTTIDHAESILLERMRQCGCLEVGGGAYRSPLCGSTPSFDRGFLRSHFLKLHSAFSYRHVDVSSFKEIAVRWYGSDPTPAGISAHRALPDVHHSISALKAIRAACFRNPRVQPAEVLSPEALAARAAR